jgi:hypothetical protein
MNKQMRTDITRLHAREIHLLVFLEHQVDLKDQNFNKE